jgi:hypothetical protein
LAQVEAGVEWKEASEETKASIIIMSFSSFFLSFYKFYFVKDTLQHCPSTVNVKPVNKHP